MSLKRFQFIGNVTRDVEVRSVGQGKQVANIDVAVSEKWRDERGDLQESTDYFRIEVWGKPAENAAKYLGKGSSVFIEGAIKNNNYPDDKGGMVYGTKFLADPMGIQYLKTKPPGGQGEQPKEPAEPQPEAKQPAAGKSSRKRGASATAYSEASGK